MNESRYPLSPYLHEKERHAQSKKHRRKSTGSTQNAQMCTAPAARATCAQWIGAYLAMAFASFPVSVEGSAGPPNSKPMSSEQCGTHCTPPYVRSTLYECRNTGFWCLTTCRAACEAKHHHQFQQHFQYVTASLQNKSLMTETPP